MSLLGAVFGLNLRSYARLSVFQTGFRRLRVLVFQRLTRLPQTFCCLNRFAEANASNPNAPPCHQLLDV